MKDRRPSEKRRGLRAHSLSLTLGGILALWIGLYLHSDEATHLGGFYGNAIADWLGTLILVLVTKYFYEINSSESRRPHPTSRGVLLCAIIDHSLTIVLVVTGIAWAAAYARMDPGGKAGQVVGNIVSEWTQILGLVIITKYTREMGSKEGN
jgi:hypothetical protein